MEYPEWDESASDKELIEEFYHDVSIRYPELNEYIRDNQGLVHINMEAVRRLAENLCEEGNINDLRDCFAWINSLFCRSKHEMLNAISVSFLEYFDFQKGISEEEFEAIMPNELYRGYREMMQHMEKLANLPIKTKET